MGEAAPSSTGAQTDVPSGEKLIVILKMAGALLRTLVIRMSLMPVEVITTVPRGSTRCPYTRQRTEGEPGEPE